MTSEMYNHVRTFTSIKNVGTHFEYHKKRKNYEESDETVNYDEV